MTYTIRVTKYTKGATSKIKHSMKDCEESPVFVRLLNYN